jgi:hypothetical protein
LVFAFSSLGRNICPPFAHLKICNRVIQELMKLSFEKNIQIYKILINSNKVNFNQFLIKTRSFKREVKVKHKYLNLDPSFSTAFAFLNLLKRLRSVEDAACLMSQDDRHIIFSHPIFRSSEFQQFSKSVIETCSNVPDPVDCSIENVLPGVSTKLNMNFHL